MSLDMPYGGTILDALTFENSDGAGELDPGWRDVRGTPRQFDEVPHGFQVRFER